MDSEVSKRPLTPHPNGTAKAWPVSSFIWTCVGYSIWCGLSGYGEQWTGLEGHSGSCRMWRRDSGNWGSASFVGRAGWYTAPGTVMANSNTLPQVIITQAMIVVYDFQQHQSSDFALSVMLHSATLLQGYVHLPAAAEERPGEASHKLHSQEHDEVTPFSPHRNNQFDLTTAAAAFQVVALNRYTLSVLAVVLGVVLCESL